MEYTILLILSLVTIAFFAEYIDSSLGMGYGTSLVPILLLMGFKPLEIVPAILLSEFLTGTLAGIMHHKAGNVDFSIKKTNFNDEFSIASLRKSISRNTKMVIIIASCSIIGTTAAVLIAVNLSEYLLKMYIGILITIIGIYILFSFKREIEFSWKRLIGISVIASFNKGLSGGGYGPVVTGGQLLSGVNAKNAIGITSLAEGLTCAVGLCVYVLTDTHIEWVLASSLIAGGLLSIPFATATVKKLNAENLKLYIGVATLFLGCFTIIKTII